MPKSAEMCKKKGQKSTTTEKCLKVQPYICWPNNVQSRPKIHSEPCVIDLAKHHYFCEQLKNYKGCQKAPKVAINLHKKLKSFKK